jgi:hypothetical protein
MQRLVDLIVSLSLKLGIVHNVLYKGDDPFRFSINRALHRKIVDLSGGHDASI